MLKSKQFLINTSLVVFAIVAGMGTIMAVKADNFVYDTCNGEYINFYIDQDGDTFGDSTATSTAACSAPANYVTNNLDCNDVVATVRPGALEACDAIDNNCDGNINEGLATSTYYIDADGDGYGIAATTTEYCSLPTGYAINSQDCNDANASTSPAAIEICGDAIDNNCNGVVDENCTSDATTTTYYLDADGDGYGNSGHSVSSTTQPTGYVINNTDCNDANSSTSPAALEICGDAIDNNCNSVVDENCTSATTTTYYLDADGDGYGSSAHSVSSTTQPIGYVLSNTDCNDTNASTSPAALEICGDDIDNNCDGNIDTNCTVSDNDEFTKCNPFENLFSNQGGLVSCWAHYTNWLKKHGDITGKEKGAIMSTKAKEKAEVQSIKMEKSNIEKTETNLSDEKKDALLNSTNKSKKNNGDKNESNGKKK